MRNSNRFEAEAALIIDKDISPIHLGKNDPLIVRLSEQYQQVKRDQAVAEKALENIKVAIKSEQRYFVSSESYRARKQIRAQFRRQKREIYELLSPEIKELYSLRHAVDQRIRELERDKYLHLQDVRIKKEDAQRNWSTEKRAHHEKLQELYELERRTELKIMEQRYIADELWSRCRQQHRINRAKQSEIRLSERDDDRD